MLHGDRVLLRPLSSDDLPQLWRWRIDPQLWLLTDDAPLSPVTYGVFEEQMMERTSSTTEVEFAIEHDGRLVGRCGMFAFDTVAHSARVGVSIGEPADRGQGLGRDALAVLCGYGFAKRNLNRLALEVLAGNAGAVRAYEAVGFVAEGRLREHAWIDGAFEDVLVMGLLRREWQAPPQR